MILIPAIDLKQGQCVRLRQGNMEDTTVFSDDPVAMASHWNELGARRLHLVDLDGAFAGQRATDAVQAPAHEPSQNLSARRRAQQIGRYRTAKRSQTGIGEIR